MTTIATKGDNYDYDDDYNYDDNYNNDYDGREEEDCPEDYLPCEA